MNKKRVWLIALIFMVILAPSSSFAYTLEYDGNVMEYNGTNVILVLEDINDKLMAPVSWISEMCGLDVTLDVNTQNVTINKSPKEIEVASNLENVEEIVECAKKVPILMYHSVVDVATKDTEISREKFQEQIRILKEEGYKGVSLQELVDYVEKGVELPEKIICITFVSSFFSCVFF